MPLNIGAVTIRFERSEYVFAATLVTRLCNKMIHRVLCRHAVMKDEKIPFDLRNAGSPEKPFSPDTHFSDK